MATENTNELSNNDLSICNTKGAELNAHRKALSWHIPRPSLISQESLNSFRDYPRGSTSTQGSSSSNNSTQSAKSGSFLLSVANLSKLNQPEAIITKPNHHAINLNYYLNQTNACKSLELVHGANENIPNIPNDNFNTNVKVQEYDSLSIASSTHFTVINGLDRHKNRVSQKRSCCQKHKLTVLVVTMSSIFMFGIIVAIYLFEMRAMHIRNSFY